MRGTHPSSDTSVEPSSLYEVFEQDPFIRLQYINTELQKADVFTKFFLSTEATPNGVKHSQAECLGLAIPSVVRPCCPVSDEPKQGLGMHVKRKGRRRYMS